MKLRPGVFAAIVLLGLVGPDAYAADDYPTRQIKIIVPFPAGAGLSSSGALGNVPPAGDVV